MTKQPKYSYTWKIQRTEYGRQWTLIDRAARRVLGYVERGKVGQALAFRAVVMHGGYPIQCNWYDHWTGAKRAVVEALPSSVQQKVDEFNEARAEQLRDAAREAGAQL